MSVELLSGSLQTERLPDGRRRLLRDLILRVDGLRVVIPAGFVTDYSSWPRFLPGPRFSKIDLAGVVHDFVFQYGILGVGGPPMGYIDANRTWYKVARAGDHEDAKASWFWAWAGRVGLFVGSWWTWFKYRRENQSAAVDFPTYY